MHIYVNIKVGKKLMAPELRKVQSYNFEQFWFRPTERPIKLLLTSEVISKVKILDSFLVLYRVELNLSKEF